MTIRIKVTVMTILIIITSGIMTITGLCDQTVHSHPVVITSYGETIVLYQTGLYERESISMASQALAQDFVTLFVGIPLLMIALLLIHSRNSIKGWFLLSGTMAYFLYTYASYSFLMVFNKFYLLYILTMIISFYGFLTALFYLCRYEIRELFTEKYPIKALAIFLAIVGVALLFMWMGRIIPALLNGKAPYGLEHYSTLVIQSLDLGFIIPASFVTAYFLHKKKKWGYLLSAVLVMKMLTMAAAVSAMGINMKLHHVEMGIADLVVFPIIVVINILFLGRMLGTIKTAVSP